MRSWAAAARSSTPRLPMSEAEALCGAYRRKVGRSRRKTFLSTKLGERGKANGIASIERSFKNVIDLMYVHNMIDVDTHLPTLKDYKSARVASATWASPAPGRNQDEPGDVAEAISTSSSSPIRSTCAHAERAAAHGAREPASPLSLRCCSAATACSTRCAASTCRNGRRRGTTVQELRATGAEIRGLASGGDGRDPRHGKSAAHGR